MRPKNMREAIETVLKENIDVNPADIVRACKNRWGLVIPPSTASSYCYTLRTKIRQEQGEAIAATLRNKPQEVKPAVVTPKDPLTATIESFKKIRAFAIESSDSVQEFRNFLSDINKLASEVGGMDTLNQMLEILDLS